MKTKTLTGILLSLSNLICTQTALARYQQNGCYPNNACIPNTEAYCMSPCGQDRWGLAADFLYWSTDFNVISAISAELATADNGAQASIQVRHPNQKWDPGVRLTAGWFGYDNWDIKGSWTNFYNSTTNHRSPFQLQVNADNLDASGSSKFAFRYNAADLELGTTLYLQPCLSLRPLIGIHAIWTQIDSKLNLLVPSTSGPDISTDGFAVGINMNNNSWGVGPKIGVNTLWGNCMGLSFVANVNGSLVYGEKSAAMNVEVDVANVEIGTSEVNIHVHGDSYWQLMSTIQLQSGLSYLGCLFNHDFRVNALWECNMINHANDILIFDRSISTQGLTLSFEYLF